MRKYLYDFFDTQPAFIEFFNIEDKTNDPFSAIQQCRQCKQAPQTSVNDAGPGRSRRHDGGRYMKNTDNTTSTQEHPHDR